MPALPTPLPLGAVDYRGELWTRHAAATCNLLTRSDRYSIDSFRASASGTPGALWWDWPGDQLGRWLSVLHVAQGHGWAPAAANRAAIAEVVLPLQTGQGNFGPSIALEQGDVRIISGNAFALRGLTDAFEDTGDRRYLERPGGWRATSRPLRLAGGRPRMAICMSSTGTASTGWCGCMDWVAMSGRSTWLESWP